MGALFGFSGPPDEGTLKRIGEALSHRGSQELVRDESPHGSIAYRALFDEDIRGRLGAGLYQEGDQTIALAGQLIGNGVPRPILRDLLARYRERGLGFVSGLRGGFVLAIRDGDTIHLVRDGAGARTVYYGLHRDRFYFAIEPKGLLAVPDFPRRLRPGGIAQYLTFSFVPGDATMLEDVRELRPGHSLSFDGAGGLRLERHFHFEDDEAAVREEDQDADGWVERLRSTMDAAVRERLPQREPVGVFLSGGLDSSLVTADVARLHDQPVKTYAIHFGPRYPNELEFARAVAARCGTDHEEVLVRPDQFLPRLRRIIWHLDDPIGDPITMPNFELAAHVRRDVRWVFNGEGGDPCFGGPKNIPFLLEHWYGGVRRERGFRERRYLASYHRAYEELSRLLTPEWRRRIDPQADLEDVLTPFFDSERPRSLLNKLMAINIRLKGAHLILPKVERMTGAYGLTALAPLFDERIVRMSFEMPPRLKLRHGVDKWILKRAYERDLPEAVVKRPKSGMRVPVHYWFQGEMKRYARHILHKKRIREVGIFDEKRVQQLLDYQIEEGPGRYGLRLWMLLTFEIWRRLVFEGEKV